MKAQPPEGSNPRILEQPIVLGRRFSLVPVVHKDGARDDGARKSSSRFRWLGKMRGGYSLLTLRILGVNVLPLAILIGGLMYLDVYRESLIEAEAAKLATNGQIFSGALGEGAVRGSLAGTPWLDPEASRMLVRRLVEPAGSRARVFVATGDLVADSRTLMGLRAMVRIEELPPPRRGGVFVNAVVDFYDWLAELVDTGHEYPLYREAIPQHASDYTEVVRALAGDKAKAVRLDEHGRLVVSVSIPVQRYKKVVGALLLSSASGEIEKNLREVRIRSLQVFTVVLALTILLSLYLARTIVRPIMRLAHAAERVRRGMRRETEIPDFSARQDEIGDLSGALRDMTEALWRRMDAIEGFAADVAHEIKNPLSSLRSAVETAARVEDPKRQRQLMSIILEDVQRLDRLISDISHASRLDAQLSRREWSDVDVAQLLAALVAVHEATARFGADGTATRIVLAAPESARLVVRGDEDQLVQVFRNIINNAMSFTPESSEISISAIRDGDEVVVSIDDQGPGISEADFESVFDRFYSSRPAAEKFGTHSGLGLSISKQIVEAHGGTIHAGNVIGDNGAPSGARFTIRLPLA